MLVKTLKKVANCLFVNCMDNRTAHLLMKQGTKYFVLRLLRARTSPQQPMPCHCTSNGPTTKPTFGNMLFKPFLPSEVVMDTVGLCMQRRRWTSKIGGPALGLLSIVNCLDGHAY